jgi:hypothetical protein
VISTTIKFKIQFVAAPSAAPFVRIVRELISVGYTREEVRDNAPKRQVVSLILTPRDTLHTNSEEDVVQEEECHRSGCNLLRIGISW